jgi:hypothetical protein
VIDSQSNGWLVAKQRRYKMDLGWEMALIVEFVLCMGLLIHCWLFQEQMGMEVICGFRHQSNFSLERVIVFAAGLRLRVVVTCHDSSRRHFLRVD